MKASLGVGGLAICLIFLPAVALAAESVAQPEPAAARAAKPRCAKLVCQHRTFSSDKFSSDQGVSAESAAAAASEFGVSLLVGLGAGAFRGAAQDTGFVRPLEIIERPEPELPPGVAQIDSGGGPAQELVVTGSRRPRVAGPALSLGVALDQPLLATSALELGLEERFTLAAVLPLSGASCVAGFGDILLTAHPASIPVQVAVGPSLAVAELDARGDDAELFYEAGVIVGGAALVRLDLSRALPGSLDLVGHYGKTLNYDDSSYRDLQLAFALEL